MKAITTISKGAKLGIFFASLVDERFSLCFLYPLTCFLRLRRTPPNERPAFAAQDFLVSAIVFFPPAPHGHIQM